jgi:hypothetical protein
VFTVNTPMQVGIADYMRDPAPYLDLPAFYQKNATSSAPASPTRASSCCPARHLLPVRRLFGHQRSARSRVRAMADERDRRGGDSGVGVLSRVARIGRRALLLRKAGKTLATALDRLARL